MENEAFEMQGENIPEISSSKKEFRDEKPKFGNFLLRFFLLCLLASILSTTIGVLILGFSWKNSLEFPTDSGSGEKTEEKVEAKFGFFHQLSKSKVYKYPGGEIQWARFRRDPSEYESAEVAEFGQSLNFHRSQITVGTLRILSQGLRAPHWHLNANEHGYLVKGKAWIGVIGSDGSTAVTYNVTQGQVIFFPRNTVHWVKNVGSSELLFLLFFSTHDELLTLDVDDVFYGTPEDVAARALQPEGGVQFIRTFQKPKEDQAINLPKNLDQLIHNSSYPQSPDSQVWKFFFDLPASQEFPFPGGIFQWARFRKNGTGLTENEKIFSQSLHEHENSLTLATLRIFSNNLGIPHFHFNANEMGIVISGCGQVGLTLPDGYSQFSIGIGDVIFFPLGSQHFVQSFCQEDLVLVLAYSTGNQEDLVLVLAYSTGNQEDLVLVLAYSTGNQEDLVLVLAYSTGNQEDLVLVLAYSTGNQLETLRMNQYFHGTADHILAQLFSKDQLEFQKIPKKSS